MWNDVTAAIDLLVVCVAVFILLIGTLSGGKE
jgi:hypothetical protein